MGWRGKDGTEHLRGEPNPKQWEMYAKNNCVFQYHMPETMHYMRNWNREYLDFAKDKGWRQSNDPVQLALYSDTLQTFRLAAQGKTPGRQPPEHLRERIATYFDPLPFWYPPLEDARDRPRRLSRSTRSRSGRWRCTTRGIRRTPGCARSTATTTCT